MVSTDIAELLVSTEKLKPLLCREQHPRRGGVTVTVLDQLLLNLFLCGNQDSKVVWLETSSIDPLPYLLLRVEEDDHPDTVMLARAKESAKEVYDGLGLTDPRVEARQVKTRFAFAVCHSLQLSSKVFDT